MQKQLRGRSIVTESKEQPSEPIEPSEPSRPKGNVPIPRLPDTMDASIAENMLHFLLCPFVHSSTAAPYHTVSPLLRPRCRQTHFFSIFSPFDSFLILPQPNLLSTHPPSAPFNGAPSCVASLSRLGSLSTPSTGESSREDD